MAWRRGAGWRDTSLPEVANEPPPCHLCPGSCRVLLHSESYLGQKIHTAASCLQSSIGTANSTQSSVDGASKASCQHFSSFQLNKKVEKRFFSSSLNISTSLRHSPRAQRWSGGQGRFPRGLESHGSCSRHTVHRRTRQYTFC